MLGVHNFSNFMETNKHESTKTSLLLSVSTICNIKDQVFLSLSKNMNERHKYMNEGLGDTVCG